MIEKVFIALGLAVLACYIPIYWRALRREIDAEDDRENESESNSRSSSGGVGGENQVERTDDSECD